MKKKIISAILAGVLVAGNIAPYQSYAVETDGADVGSTEDFAQVIEPDTDEELIAESETEAQTLYSDFSVWNETENHTENEKKETMDVQEGGEITLPVALHGSVSLTEETEKDLSKDDMLTKHTDEEEVKSVLEYEEGEEVYYSSRLISEAMTYETGIDGVYVVDESGTAYELAFSEYDLNDVTAQVSGEDFSLYAAENLPDKQEDDPAPEYKEGETPFDGYVLRIQENETEQLQDYTYTLKDGTKSFVARMNAENEFSARVMATVSLHLSDEHKEILADGGSVKVSGFGRFLTGNEDKTAEITKDTVKTAHSAWKHDSSMTDSVFLGKILSDETTYYTTYVKEEVPEEPADTENTENGDAEKKDDEEDASDEDDEAEPKQDDAEAVEEPLEDPADAEVKEEDEAKVTEEENTEAEGVSAEDDTEKTSLPAANRTSKEVMDQIKGIDFSAKRILLGTESEQELALTDDAHLISSYDGLYLLEFDSEAKALDAYVYYSSIPAISFVSTDFGLEIADDQDDEIEADDPKEGSIVTDTKMSEEENPIASLQDAMEEKNNEKFDVAIIDTGVGEDLALQSVSMIGDDTADYNGHGTDMAKALLEIAPDAKILSIKALGDDGKGDASAVYAGIMYAIEKNVKVINLSMSAYSSANNSMIAEAARQAEKAGITVVGAAGNNNKNARWYVPGNIREITTVGACDENGFRVASSNYGSIVDYFVNASSTSYAAAKMSGFILANGKAFEDGNLVFEKATEHPVAENEDTDPEENDDTLHVNANTTISMAVVKDGVYYGPGNTSGKGATVSSISYNGHTIANAKGSSFKDVSVGYDVGNVKNDWIARNDLFSISGSGYCGFNVVNYDRSSNEYEIIFYVRVNAGNTYLTIDPDGAVIPTYNKTLTTSHTYTIGWGTKSTWNAGSNYDASPSYGYGYLGDVKYTGWRIKYWYFLDPDKNEQTAFYGNYVVDGSLNNNRAGTSRSNWLNYFALNYKVWTKNGYYIPTNKLGPAGTSNGIEKATGPATNGQVSVKPKWVENRWFIRYHGNGSTSGQVTTSYGDNATTWINYTQSYKLDKNGFAKTGYRFTGWNTKADGSGTTYTDQQTVSRLTAVNDAEVGLYAQWTPVAYTATLDKNGANEGDTGSEHVYYLYQEKTAYSDANRTKQYADNKIVTPKRTGYVFAGYVDDKGTEYISADGTVKDALFNHQGNITLKAKWTYNITFQPNYPANKMPSSMANYQGSGSTAKITVNADDSAAVLPDSGFSIAGYDFVGWSTQPATGRYDYDTHTYTPVNGHFFDMVLKNTADISISNNPTPGTADKPITNVTMYAYWTPTTKNISYSNTDGISGLKTKYAAANGQFSLADPFKAGYEFLGWTGEGVTTPTKNLKVTYSMMLDKNGNAKDLKFTANWKERPVVPFVDESTMKTPVLTQSESNKDGKFKIVETQSAPGYIYERQEKEISIRDSKNKGEKTLEAEFKNTPNEFQIHKAGTDNVKLPGATFEVWYENETSNAVSYVTDDDGVIYLYGLKPGTWHYKETEAPAGYAVDPRTFSITVDSNSVIKEGTAVDGTKVTSAKETVIVDQPEDKQPIYISKKTSGGSSIKGVTFEITFPNGTKNSMTTDGTGFVKLDAPANGTYSVKETKVPDGYILDSTVHTFTVTSSKISGTDNAYVYTIVNKENHFELVKSGANGEKLSGVGFEIWRGSETPEIKYTDANGKIEMNGLKNGTWHYKEVSTKEGYILDTKTYNFTVSGSLIEGKQSHTVTVTNKKNSFVITKNDAAKKAVSGVKFHIYSTNGYDETKTTGSDGKITLTGLAKGTYSFVEIPVAGYVADTKVYTFTVTDTGITSDKTTPVVNTENGFELIKKNADGSVLAGVTYKFTYSGSGKNPFSTPEKVTDSKGKITLSKLPAGEYTFVETKTNDSVYILDQTVHTFTVTATGTVTTNDNTLEISGKGAARLTMTTVNHKYPKVNVSVKKVDEKTGETLKGAEFVLYQKVSGTYKKVDTLTYNQSKDAYVSTKTISLTKDNSGAFKIEETKVPSGYTGSYVKEFTVPETEQDKTLDFAFTATNTPIEVSFKKVDENGKPMSGVKFNVWLKDQKATEYISDENGMITIHTPAQGTWYYQETETKDGYKLDSTVRSFVVAKDGVNHKTETVLANVVNNPKLPKTVEVRVNKEDANGKKLTGAEFEIQRYNAETKSYEKIGDMVYDESLQAYKNAQTIALTPDEIETETSRMFMIVETRNPDGYYGTFSQKFTVSNKEQSVETFTYTAKNYENEIKVLKEDQYGSPVSGVTFTLHDETGNINITDKTAKTGTDGSARFTALAPGRYSVQETEAPAGYKMDDTKKFFTVKQDGTIVADSARTKAITFEIPEGASSVTMVCVDGEGNPATDLSGTTFYARKSTDSSAKKYTVNANGEVKLSSISAGNYRATSDVLPEGYTWMIHSDVSGGSASKVTQIVFATPEAKGQGSVSATFVNQSNRLTIKKVNEKNEPLSGVTFKIWMLDANGNETKTATVKTGADGTYSKTALTPGTWQFKETANSYGYPVPDQTFTVIVNEDSTITRDEYVDHETDVTYTVMNSKSYPEGEIKIRKVDADNQSKAITDAEFTVQEFNPETQNYTDLMVNGKPYTLTYNASTGYYEGKVKVSGSNAGLFKVYESKAPAGYYGDWSASIDLNLKKTWIFDVRTGENSSNEGVVTNSKSQFGVFKTDSVTGKPINGITFNLVKINATAAKGTPAEFNGYYTTSDDTLDFGDVSYTGYERDASGKVVGTSWLVPEGEGTIARYTQIEGQPLAKAVIKVSDVAVTSTKQTKTTGTDGKAQFTGLQAASYYVLTETKDGTAAGSYNVDETPHIIYVSADGRMHGLPFYTENVKNTPKNTLGEVVIRKTDEETGESVENVVFNVYEYNKDTASYNMDSIYGKLSYDETTKKYVYRYLEWTEQNQGKFFVREDSTPSHYVQAWEQYISFDRTGNAIHTFGESTENGQKYFSVTNKPITIRTTAVDTKTGKHTINPDGNASITDTVAIKNAQYGETYMLTGKLVNKAASEEAGKIVYVTDSDDKVITSRAIFTVSKDGKTVTFYELKNGSYQKMTTGAPAYKITRAYKDTTAPNGVVEMTIDMPFGFDASEMEDVDVVVFETLNKVRVDENGTIIITEKTEFKQSANVEENPNLDEVTDAQLALSYKVTLPANGGEAASHKDIDDEGQTVKITPEEEETTPVFSTTLVDTKTGDHIARVTTSDSLTDTVSLKDLRVGAHYKLEGYLVYKEDYKDSDGKTHKAGDVVRDKNNKPVQKTLTFTAEHAEEDRDVVFSLDTRKLSDTKIVAYETLYLQTVDGSGKVTDETELVAHGKLDANGKTVISESYPSVLNDESQTVYFASIHTTAKTQKPLDTNNKVGSTDGSQVITDVVQFHGLKFGLTDDEKAALNAELSELDARIQELETAIKNETNSTKKATLTAEKEYMEKTRKPALTARINLLKKDNESGTVYKVYGSLRSKALKGETIVIDGKRVTQSATITISKTGAITAKTTDANGKTVNAKVTEVKKHGNTVDFKVELNFYISDASKLEGQTAVVYETLQHHSQTVAAHSNINDEGQTVRFPMNITLHAGSRTDLWMRLAALAAMMIGLGVFVNYKKKNRTA